MAVSFQLPTHLEQELRSGLRDLDGEAKEALLVSLYRQRKLSHLALSKALGLDRFETEDVLRKHKVTEDLGTVEDYLTDATALAKFRKNPLMLVVADAFPLVGLVKIRRTRWLSPLIRFRCGQGWGHNVSAAADCGSQLLDRRAEPAERAAPFVHDFQINFIC